MYILRSKVPLLYLQKFKDLKGLLVPVGGADQCSEQERAREDHCRAIPQVLYRKYSHAGLGLIFLSCNQIVGDPRFDPNQRKIHM